MLRSAKDGITIMIVYTGEAGGLNVATASRIVMTNMTLQFRSVRLGNKDNMLH